MRIRTLSTPFLVLSLALLSSFAACSKAGDAETDDTGTKKVDGGSSGGDTGVPTVQNPGPPVTGDGGKADAGPTTFDLLKVTSIQGTFVTDKTGLNGINSNATVTWSFKIDNFTDVTLAGATAKWSVQATNVVGGNVSDFPPESGITLAVTHPSTGTWELYASDPTTPHYYYVLVKIADGSIKELHYYRRLLDDTETPPVVDYPKNLTYTVTTK